MGGWVVCPPSGAELLKGALPHPPIRHTQPPTSKKVVAQESEMRRCTETAIAAVAPFGYEKKEPRRRRWMPHHMPHSSAPTHLMQPEQPRGTVAHEGHVVPRAVAEGPAGRAHAADAVRECGAPRDAVGTAVEDNARGLGVPEGFGPEDRPRAIPWDGAHPRLQRKAQDCVGEGQRALGAAGGVGVHEAHGLAQRQLGLAEGTAMQVTHLRRVCVGGGGGHWPTASDRGAVGVACGGGSVSVGHEVGRSGCGMSVGALFEGGGGSGKEVWTPPPPNGFFSTPLFHAPRPLPLTSWHTHCPSACEKLCLCGGGGGGVNTPKNGGQENGLP